MSSIFSLIILYSDLGQLAQRVKNLSAVQETWVRPIPSYEAEKIMPWFADCKYTNLKETGGQERKGLNEDSLEDDRSDF